MAEQGEKTTDGDYRPVCDGRTTRANVTAATWDAPAANKAWAQALTVAPVVHTSSTSTNRLSAIRAAADRSVLNAPCTFFRRPEAPPCVPCSAVRRTRVNAQGANGTPVNADVARESSAD
jgi:hypothetical protein